MSYLRLIRVRVLFFLLNLQCSQFSKAKSCSKLGSIVGCNQNDLHFYAERAACWTSCNTISLKTALYFSLVSFLFWPVTFCALSPKHFIPSRIHKISQILVSHAASCLLFARPPFVFCFLFSSHCIPLLCIFLAAASLRTSKRVMFSGWLTGCWLETRESS